MLIEIVRDYKLKVLRVRKIAYILATPEFQQLWERSPDKAGAQAAIGDDDVDALRAWLQKNKKLAEISSRELRRLGAVYKIQNVSRKSRRDLLAEVTNEVRRTAGGVSDSVGIPSSLHEDGQSSQEETADRR